MRLACFCNASGIFADTSVDYFYAIIITTYKMSTTTVRRERGSRNENLKMILDGMYAAMFLKVYVLRVSQ